MKNPYKVAATGMAVLIGFAAAFFLPTMEQGPHLAIPMENDLGELQYDQKKRISIAFRNEGNELLKISDISVGCDCVATELVKKEYAPGESGRIDLEYHAGGFSGAPIRQSLLIASNDAAEPLRRIALVGKMTSTLAASPARLHVRGVPVGDEWSRELEVISTEARETFEILGVTSDIEDLQFTITKETPTEHFVNQTPGSLYKIRVHQPTVGKLGEHVGRIRIDTSSRRFPSVTVPVTIEAVTAFQFEPPLLFLRQSAASTSADSETRTLTIHSPEAVELEFRGNDPLLECLSESAGPAKEWVFTCRAKPEIEGTHRWMLEFDVKGYPPESSITVPFAIVAN